MTQRPVTSDGRFHLSGRRPVMQRPAMPRSVTSDCIFHLAARRRVYLHSHAFRLTPADRAIFGQLLPIDDNVRFLVVIEFVFACHSPLIGMLQQNNMLYMYVHLRHPTAFSGP